MSRTRTPLWAAIARTLSDEIAAGHVAPGDRLPTEAALAQRFGVNRHTVRRALGRLAEDGLVLSRRGSGVFVQSRPTDYALGRRVRFQQNLAANGQLASRQVLSLATRPADAEEAAALSLAPGDRVHAFEGLSLADGQPLALFLSLFPADRFPDLPALLSREGSVTRALAQSGVSDYLRASTRLTALLATPTQALHLRLREGAPVLRSVAVNTDLAGRPVEFGTTWFAGDRITLTLGGTMSQNEGK